MKILKFLFVTTLVLFLGLGNLNAQNNKVVKTGSWEWGDIMPCTDDYAFGTETVVITRWGSKVQIRYKGAYKGDSGKHYTWSAVVNNNWNEFVEGETFNKTYRSTSVVECEGVPIALYKIRYHVTINANGEITVEKYSYSGDSWVCL